MINVDTNLWVAIDIGKIEEYRQINKFVKKIKKGAKPKRSGRYKLASSALNTDD
jgi:hypothetical protein